jgi:hypothetical protein
VEEATICAAACCAPASAAAGEAPVASNCETRELNEATACERLTPA